MSSPKLDRPGVYYPDSDGKPLESDTHRKLMCELIEVCELHFEDDSDVYAAGNLGIYYVEGDPTKVIVPDFFVARVPRRDRLVFKLWEEPNGPQVVIELSSKKTFRRDLGLKRRRYESVGVEEYYIFDPTGELLKAPFLAYRLEGGSLEPVPIVERADGLLVATSAALGLELHARDLWLRWADPISGALLATKEERAETERVLREAAEDRAQAAEDRAQAAEAELARLRAELDRRRGAHDS